MGQETAVADGTLALPPGVHGAAQPQFSAAVNGFRRLFARKRGGGALAVYHHGRLVVDIWAGSSDRAGRVPWAYNTATVPYSTTKGIATTVIHRLADRGLLDYDAPVAEYWPEFGSNGKARITVREVLSHRAGLSGLPGIARTLDDILDFRLMEQRLAAAKPDRYLGVPAYHSLTYGWLLSGIARAITGFGMAELFRREIAEPIGTDEIWLGAPPASAKVVASEFSGSPAVLGSRIAQRVIPVARRVPGPSRALVRTILVPGIEDLFAGDDPPILHTEMPAANAVATARGLAAMYNAILSSDDGAGRFLSAETVRQLGRIQTRQLDRTLFFPMRWRLGYHSFPFPGAAGAFGHLGLAGSGAWLDQRSGIAVGFVHNRLPEPRFMLIDQTILGWLSPLIMRGVAPPRQRGSRMRRARRPG
ncbi:beta-lactamase family protein [Skermania sp. ID1734]|uniref:serine hydrolase domain-containing protein n=1 Tax=Skermania sp. ID1734 TaxID=2597516 RepID=UPI00118125FA|nr:serine hydrolase domain-containing protein [Skermania sp. ID1734]TSD97252.1 beta-lactamase family protein [Skermania sp. ID1734]